MQVLLRMVIALSLLLVISGDSYCSSLTRDATYSVLIVGTR